ncbi:hypothetical protein [Flavobacterium branchiicola]|uniref:Uncharacterized protein n=1 Tax=Flavobacterium branchiicola TaxID=1114875 RepID=A0ABV9PCD8_9FLAO|nr:hypothetical protein [Flavobacterium branchiicola]MBS7253617.1 hypothetical protein [Flavobacterium branchiicola]
MNLLVTIYLENMKRYTIILGLILISLSSYAQTGINTLNPHTILHVDGAKDNPLSGAPTAAQQANDVAVTAQGNLGVGTIAPAAKLEVVGTAAIPPIKAVNMQVSNTATVGNKRALIPVVIDNAGVMIGQFSPIQQSGGYSVDGEFAAGATIFNTIHTGTIIVFEFMTNFALGDNDTSAVYGKITYTVKNGFQVNSDWNFTGDATTSGVTVTGAGTNTLTFDSDTGSDLVFTLTGTPTSSTGVISARKAGTGANLVVYVFNGRKIR